MAYLLNDSNRAAIQRRTTAAYWYAVGWSDATESEDYAEEFRRFVEAEVTAYETGEVSMLSSIPDQWKRFIDQHLAGRI